MKCKVHISEAMTRPRIRQLTAPLNMRIRLREMQRIL